MLSVLEGVISFEAYLINGGYLVMMVDAFIPSLTETSSFFASNAPKSTKELEGFGAKCRDSVEMRTRLMRLE